MKKKGDIAMDCPDCELPMVWMRDRWRCQCRTEILEERGAARLDLQAVVWLPESVQADRFQLGAEIAEEVIADQGLQRVEGESWHYHPAEHAMVTWVYRPALRLSILLLLARKLQSCTKMQELLQVLSTWRRGEGSLAGLLLAWWEVATGRVDCDGPCLANVKLW